MRTTSGRRKQILLQGVTARPVAKLPWTSRALGLLCGPQETAEARQQRAAAEAMRAQLLAEWQAALPASLPSLSKDRVRSPSCAASHHFLLLPLAPLNL